MWYSKLVKRANRPVKSGKNIPAVCRTHIFFSKSGLCALYHWKPFWLATEVCPQLDWMANYCGLLRIRTGLMLRDQTPKFKRPTFAQHPIGWSAKKKRLPTTRPVIAWHWLILIVRLSTRFTYKNLLIGGNIMSVT